MKIYHPCYVIFFLILLLLCFCLFCNKREYNNKALVLKNYLIYTLNVYHRMEIHIWEIYNQSLVYQNTDPDRFLQILNQQVLPKLIGLYQEVSADINEFNLIQEINNQYKRILHLRIQGLEAIKEGTITKDEQLILQGQFFLLQARQSIKSFKVWIQEIIEAADIPMAIQYNESYS